MLSSQIRTGIYKETGRYNHKDEYEHVCMLCHTHDTENEFHFVGLTSLPSHYITVTQIQYILIISIAWEFATN